MAEADSEDRRLANEFADLVELKFERFRIAGAIREEDAVGLECEHVLGGCSAGTTVTRAPMCTGCAECCA